MQCQLITWFALLAAQLQFMHLQVRLLEYVFGKNIELPKGAHKKKHVIRIESKMVSHEGG